LLAPGAPVISPLAIVAPRSNGSISPRYAFKVMSASTPEIDEISAAMWSDALWALIASSEA
jgi:hypothetical protein